MRRATVHAMRHGKVLARILGIAEPPPPPEPPTVTGVTRGDAVTGDPALVPLPATTGGDDELLLLFLVDHNGTAPSTPSGWQLLELVNLDMAAALLICWRDTDGTEDGTNASIPLGTGADVVSWHLYHIEGWEGTSPPESVSTNHAAGVQPDPPSLAVSWGSTQALWFAAMGGHNPPSAFPADYGNGLTDGGINEAAIGSARQELEADTDDPGPFTVDFSSAFGDDRSASATVAVRGT